MDTNAFRDKIRKTNNIKNMNNYYGFSPDINKIGHDKMVDKVLERSRKEQVRISETDFIDFYGKEQVEKNLRAVLGLKREFDDSTTQEDLDAKKLADVLEFIMNKQIELSDWLGEDVYTYKTSYYDDWVNGVDTLLEFNREENPASYMGIAFDITYSDHLHKKLNRIKDEIDNGQMATIKYFKSENEDFTGKLSNIPRLVIGADRKTIDELMELELAKKNKELGEYFLQYQIIDEIITQLVFFSEYATRIGKVNIANKYNSTLKTIREILSKKRKVGSEIQLKNMGTRDSFIISLTECCRDVFLEK